MKTPLKIASGIGGLIFAAPSSYGIYHVWDLNNPNGNTKLIEHGYTPNQPKVKSHESLNHGCAENLFEAKSGIDPSKIYGCSVMKMEKSSDDWFIKFNSEVALRKGNQGWIINTLLDNYFKHTYSNGKQLYRFRFGYVFTKKNLDGDKKSESWFFWETGLNYAAKKIYLKVPKKNEDAWYDSGIFVQGGNETHQGHSRDNITFDIQKDWSGAWISDNSEGTANWIFENLEIWGNEKESSEVFCKSLDKNDCYKWAGAGSRTAYPTENEHSKTWFENFDSSNKKQVTGAKVSGTNISSKIEEMINQVKGIRGNWIDLNEVCGWRWNRNIDEDHLNKLKIYCSRKAS